MKNKPKMHLSIIIVSFETRPLLKQCIRSLINNTNGLKYEIIVIDNGSKDRTYQMLKRRFPQVRLIRNYKNLGFARAVNQGLKISFGKYILLLNSDCLIIDNSLKILVDSLDKKFGPFIIAPKLLNSDGSLFFSCRRFSNFLNQTWPFLPFFNRHVPKAFKFDINDRKFYSSPQQVDYVWGACILFPKKLLEHLEGLDEKFFMYAEEEDFCYRAKQIGWSTIYYPKASVIHIGQGSSSRHWEKSVKQLYYSKYLFFRKHYGIFYASCFRLIIALICLVTIAGYKFFLLSPKRKQGRFSRSLHIKQLILTAYASRNRNFYSY